MIWYILLELAIGEIQPDVVEPKQTFTSAYRYYLVTRNCGSMLAILDVIRDAGDIERLQFINVPFGLPVYAFTQFIEYLKIGDVPDSSTVPIWVDEWLTIDGRRVGMGRAIAELRNALRLYCNREDTHPRLDEYVLEVYESLISGIYKVTRKYVE